MKSIKSQRTTSILKNTSKAEHKVYIVDFKTREYSVIGETHPQTIKKQALFEKELAQTGTDSKRSFSYPTQSKLLHPDLTKTHYMDTKSEINFTGFLKASGLVILFALFLGFWAVDLFAREPQGEFSVLLENGKSRSDFKDKKEMMKFVKQEEKKYNKNVTKTKGK